MVDKSARLGLPYLVSGQAQKDVTHNEALALIDAALAPSAESAGVNLPPPSAELGRCWIVGSAPEGAWSGRAHALAAWTDGGWRFLAAAQGMRVWLKDQQLWATYIGSGWAIGEERAARLAVGGVPVVGSRKAPVPAPTGGAIVDAEARQAIAALIARLQEHGLIESGG